MHELYKIEGIMKKSGLPTFDEIKTMDTEINFSNNDKIGSYRISFKLLDRLACDSSITSSALVTLLYLVQISDADNFVSEFHYKEIVENKRNNGKKIFSVKTFYNSLKLLKALNYIEYSDKAFCTRNIKILGNDIKQHETFLNINHEALVFGTVENDVFLSFPVKAQMLFLLLLSRAYSIRKHGSRIDLFRLKSTLKVKERAFDEYLAKISALLGEIPREKNNFTRKKRWTVTIPLKNRHKYQPKEHMFTGQANYFGRMFDRLLSTYKSSEIPLYYEKEIQDGYLKTSFFTLLKQYLNFGAGNVFKVFEYVISESSGMTYEALNNATIILANA